MVFTVRKLQIDDINRDWVTDTTWTTWGAGYFLASSTSCTGKVLI